MGNKNAAKREKKKAPKPQPKAAPGGRRDDSFQTTTRISSTVPEKN
jgi:hypothetical protein